MRFVASDVVNALKQNLDEVLKRTPQLQKIVDELRPYIYIVGGFVRDSYFRRRARDIDMMVDVDCKQLRSVINQAGCLYAINRHGGMKLYVGTMVVDIWTLDSNWAFISNSVQLREDSKLNSIAQGCFYNYDSLVIRLKDYRYNLRNFEDFWLKRELDILEGANYQARNPVFEANILRAFYIRDLYGATFSERVKNYIFEEVVNVDLKDKDVWSCLSRTQELYPKYKKLDRAKIKAEIQTIMKDVLKKQPYLFDLSHLTN